MVLISLDEVQNVRSSDKLSQLLTALADPLARTYTVHDAAGNPHERHLPIAVYLSPEQRTLTHLAERMGMRATNLGSATQRLEHRGLLIRGRLYRSTARVIEGYLRGEWPPPP